MSETSPRFPAGAARACVRARAAAAVLAGAVAAIPLCADAVPVVPMLQGYGVETPAGRGGQVFRVTNLNTSGAGSLQACVDASGPRVCVFEVSGTIRATRDLIIRNPYITIAGQTAPSPGIMYRGGALWVQASHVLVQHMRFRAGDDAAGPTPYRRFAQDRRAERIHCQHRHRPLLVQLGDRRRGEPVGRMEQRHPEQQHHLRGPVRLDQLARHGRLRSARRTLGRPGLHHRQPARSQLLAQPLSRASQMVFVNNVVYGSGNMDVDLQSEGLVTNNTIIGNVFLRGPGSTYSNKPVHIRNTGNWPVPSTSKVYVSDNQAVEATSDPWSVVDATGGSVPVSMKATLPPSWPSHMTRLPAGEDVTLNRVLNNSGARPADRDPVDARVVRQVRDRSGQIINCVAPNDRRRAARGRITSRTGQACPGTRFAAHC